jgi:hypothetical protein
MAAAVAIAAAVAAGSYCTTFEQAAGTLWSDVEQRICTGAAARSPRLR